MPLRPVLLNFNLGSTFLRKLFFCLFFVFAPHLQIQAVTTYSEYWQQLLYTMWENDSYAIKTFSRIETGNHLRTYRLLMLSEQFGYKATKDLTFEFHYTYIHGHSIVPDSPWRWQHRLEFEANYIFRLNNDNYLRTRNRFEVRWIKQEPKCRNRLRQLSVLVFPIENAGSLKAFSMYNELFYDLSTHKFDQDRICPCLLTFALFGHVKLDVFFMLRLFLSNDEWQRSAVLGTQVNF